MDFFLMVFLYFNTKPQFYAGSFYLYVTRATHLLIKF